MELNDADLLELGRKTHATFPKERNHCSVYGVGWADGKVTDLKYTACHAGLMNYTGMFGRDKGRERIPLDKEGNGPCVISNQVQSERDWLGWKDAEKYYQFLFNDSVFAPCYVTKDPTTIKEMGITVRTDQPPNLVVAACIATRQAWEYKAIGAAVVYLIEGGVEPRKAHLAAHHIIVNKKTNTFSRATRLGHIAVYGSYMGKQAVKNFLAGQLVDDEGYNGGTYQEKRSYNGIPYMWGSRDGGTLYVEGGEGNEEAQDYNSDPFGFIKKLVVRNTTVVDAVNEAYERLLK